MALKRSTLAGMILVAAIPLAAPQLWASGSEEMSADRAEYLAEEGEIILPDEIHEDSFISSVDYNYPDPEGSIGVSFFSGHNQLSNHGQEIILVVGIQGRRLRREDLPPMNQAFVIDKSGSMCRKDKMIWVADCFEIFLENMRDVDRVSVVTFDDRAEVLIPPTLIADESVRQRLLRIVRGIEPGGGSNLTEGLRLGYEQVLSNFDVEQVNRVLYLTDGVGRSEGALEVAQHYNKLGVGVTAVGLGRDFDMEFIRDISTKGGGTARFLSGRETMEEIFGSDLARMTVTAARDVTVELRTKLNLSGVQTWAPDYELRLEWDQYGLAEWLTEDQVPPRPVALAADKTEFVYVLDQANHVVQKFDRSGGFVMEWGGEGRGRGKFQDPSDIAVDPRGFVYVADTENRRVQKFSDRGDFLDQWSRATFEDDQGEKRISLDKPVSVAVDSLGHVYVADSGHRSIVKFDGEGEVLGYWPRIGLPTQLAIDPYRNVYALEPAEREIHVYESDGTLIDDLACRGAGGQFTSSDVCVDRHGTIYATDAGATGLHRFNIDGDIMEGLTLSAPAPPGLGGMTIDNAGSFYVAQASAHSVSKFDSRGVPLIRQPITYRFPNVNHGNYETVIVTARLPALDQEGVRAIARVDVSFTDNKGQRVSLAPIELTIELVAQASPVEGLSNATALKAGCMLRYAQALRHIGANAQAKDFRTALDQTNRAKKELINARERLGGDHFADEIATLEKYVTILGERLSMSRPEIRNLVEDRDLPAPTPERPLMEHLEHLFREVALDLQRRATGSIGVSGFTLPDGRRCDLLNLLDKTAEIELFEHPDLTVLEREQLTRVLEEQQLGLSDMADPDRALDVGRLLSAQYVVTGSVIEMSSSLAVFCRVIDVETGAVQSAAQVIIPRNQDINSLLRKL